MMEDFKGAKDLDGRRSVTLENGNKLIIERTDPYGFWKVHYEKGQIPDKLSGLYTSYDRAMVDVNSYIATLKPTEESVDKKPKAKLSNAS